MDTYDSALATLLGFGAAAIIVLLAIVVLSIVACWIIFKKANEHGWAAIVPLYNNFVFFKISWGNGWYFLLTVVPALIASYLTPSAAEKLAGAPMPALAIVMNLIVAVVSIITLVKFAKAFGKGGGFAVGLIFLNTIFLCIMAFSKDIQYVGVGGNTAPEAPTDMQSGDRP
ncbi:MAG: DUF5684 domain-containing protein [Oscillospiraceae bacterium]|jgi:hypothetical protein